MYNIISISEGQLFVRRFYMENQVKDIIIKALQDAGYDVEIDNRMLIVDDYDTNNGVAVKIEALP
jgi:hypothetical protein